MLVGVIGYLLIHLSSAESVDTEPTVGIVVKYKTNTDENALQTRLKKVTRRERRDIKPLRMKVMDVDQSKRETAIRDIEADPQVEYAEPDFVRHPHITTPNDTYYPQQWAWPKVQSNVVWDKTKGAGIVIADIDTGINFSHPEFAGKLVTGYDFRNDDNDPSDDAEHGTWTAGVIGAVTNNGVGVAGGCWDCKIMPLKTDDADGGLSSDSTEAIQYAADHGANVINMSFGGDTASKAEQDAVNYALAHNVVVVASAGNDSNSVPQYPASYPGVISVAATDQNDTLTSYSSFGTNIVVAAPGAVRTTANPGNGYSDVEGTSFSSPIVASIAGLLKSAYPSATVDNIRSAITTTADPCCSNKIKGGRVNADKALTYLAGLFPTSDTTKPVIGSVTPATNTTVSGTVTITVSATDNIGVSRVQMQVDGGSATIDTTSPYSFAWSTAAIGNGTHVITITAFDAAGNNAVTTLNLNVQNTTTTPKKGDINSDGKVDLFDLSLLLGNWNKTASVGDLNGDGKVNLFDVSLLLGNWNK